MLAVRLHGRGARQSLRGSLRRRTHLLLLGALADVVVQRIGADAAQKGDVRAKVIKERVVRVIEHNVVVCGWRRWWQWQVVRLRSPNRTARRCDESAHHVTERGQCRFTVQPGTGARAIAWRLRARAASLPLIDGCAGTQAHAPYAMQCQRHAAATMWRHAAAVSGDESAPCHACVSLRSSPCASARLSQHACCWQAFHPRGATPPAGVRLPERLECADAAPAY